MLNTDTMPKGISGRNRRLLTLLHRSFAAPFSVQEAAAALCFAVPRTQRFLAYLAERGWLVRVHRGLYAPVPLDAEAPSEWKEDPWVVAAKLFGPSYYIGGWTACEHWDLTEQIFRETVVFTTRRVRSKEVARPSNSWLSLQDPAHSAEKYVWDQAGLARPSQSGSFRPFAHVVDVRTSWCPRQP